MFKKIHRMAIVCAFALLIAAPAALRAADWGCEVLLCLANPMGPMAAPYCVPPIQKLYASLLKRFPDPFPQCAMAQGPGGSSWAQPAVMYYDQCPPGLAPAPAGQSIIMSASLPAALTGLSSQGTAVTAVGIGEGIGLTPYSDEGINYGVPPKPCVSGFLGTGIILQPADDEGTVYRVEVAYYQNVVILDAVNNPRAINVFINDRLYRVVRY